jgi:hypothetical protein
VTSLVLTRPPCNTIVQLLKKMKRKSFNTNVTYDGAVAGSLIGWNNLAIQEVGKVVGQEDILI